MNGFVARRLDPDARAGLRFSLLVLAGGALVGAVLPLGALIRDRWRPLVSFDRAVAADAREAVLSSDALLQAARALTHLGAPIVVDVVTVLVALLLVRLGRRRSALFLVTCTAGAYLLSTVGKQVVDRTRPEYADPVATAMGASFPSGHATGSAAVFAALSIALLPVLRGSGWRVVLRTLAVVLPLVVACTRVLLGVHFPTDVVAGLLIGWGWVAGCLAVFALWRTEERRQGSVVAEGVESAG